MALMIRLVAAGTTEAKAQDYVKYARAKGVRPRRIVFRHILRNILIPVVTVVGIEFGSLIAFSTITETVFAWPGMGKLLIDCIYQLDRPIVVAYIMLATFLFVSVNLLVDLLYAALDPRVRLAGEAHEHVPVLPGDDTAPRGRCCGASGRQPTLRGAGVLLGVIVAFALIGPSSRRRTLRPHGAERDGQPAGARRAGMAGFTFWLGTDAQGRDMLSAILYGLRTSFFVGLAATRARCCWA